MLLQNVLAGLAASRDGSPRDALLDGESANDDVGKPQTSPQNHPCTTPAVAL